MIRTIYLCSLEIPLEFLNSTPSDAKIKDRLELIKNGYRPILTINTANLLVDGYASYIAYKRFGFTKVPVLYNTGTKKIKNTTQDNNKNTEKSRIKIKKKSLTCKSKATLHSSGFDLRMIYARDNGKCYICGRNCQLDLNKRSELMATIDHVIPLSKGGMDIDSNKRLACRECNLLKGNFTYSPELVKVIKNELIERGVLDNKNEMCYNTGYQST